jgi:hypothetical protein
MPIGRRLFPQDGDTNMKRLRITLKTFAHREDGAVTVDWVVLTAGVIGLLALAMAGLRGNMTSVGQAAGDFVGSQSLNTTFN